MWSPPVAPRCSPSTSRVIPGRSPRPAGLRLKSPNGGWRRVRLPDAPLVTEFHTAAHSIAPAVLPRPARAPAPGEIRVAHAEPETALPTAKVSDSAVPVSPVDIPAQSASVTAVLEAPPAVAQVSDPAPPAAEQKPEAPPAAPRAPLWKDGTYTGWGYSRHGNIEAPVVIEGGRIASATISQCRTRYSCSVIDRLPPQVAQRQSPDVDYVSGATQSADAFYGAVVEGSGKGEVGGEGTALAHPHRGRDGHARDHSRRPLRQRCRGGDAIGAFGWFHEIEARCTRFDERSELMQLTAQAGVPVPASAILYRSRAVRIDGGGRERRRVRSDRRPTDGGARLQPGTSYRRDGPERVRAR